MGSAKAKRMERLVYVLEHASTWIPASTLAKTVGTTERSIRNYVAEINEAGAIRIESSRQGYRVFRTRIAKNKPERSTNAVGCQTSSLTPAYFDTAEQRAINVISQLANASTPLSVYDLSSSLFIGESTLASSVMPLVRKIVERFNLSCETHDFKTSLVGREQDKRKLLGHIAMRHSHGYFSSTQTLKEMFPDFDIEGILAKLVEICQRSGLFLNDYALNNLLVHVLVIIVRLTSKNELSERDDLIDANAMLECLAQRDEILRCASRIAEFFENKFGCSIPNIDYQQVILLIALSVEPYSYDELSYDKLSTLMDQSFLDTVQAISCDTCTRYDIPHFDEALLLQLTLHMYNAYQRAIYHVSYPNPIASEMLV